MESENCRAKSIYSVQYKQILKSKGTVSSHCIAIFLLWLDEGDEAPMAHLRVKDKAMFPESEQKEMKTGHCEEE